MSLPPVTDWPPPIGTRAEIFWKDRCHVATFRRVEPRCRRWRFAAPDGDFILVPGSRQIMRYLPDRSSSCVDNTNETDSQLGP